MNEYYWTNLEDYLSTKREDEIESSNNKEYEASEEDMEKLANDLKDLFEGKKVYH